MYTGVSDDVGGVGARHGAGKRKNHSAKQKRIGTVVEPLDSLRSQRMACHLALPTKSALVQSSLIPQRKFNAIAHTYLVVDDAEIVSNDVLAYSQLARYFSIL